MFFYKKKVAASSHALSRSSHDVHDFELLKVAHYVALAGTAFVILRS